MPLIKLHVPSTFPAERHEDLTAGVRTALLETLELRPQVGHVLLYVTPPSCRRVHESRSNEFVWAEVVMYAGRSPEVKDRLLQAIAQAVARHTGLAASDIVVVLIESDRTNWLGG